MNQILSRVDTTQSWATVDVRIDPRTHCGSIKCQDITAHKDLPLGQVRHTHISGTVDPSVQEWVELVPLASQSLKPISTRLDLHIDNILDLMKI